MHSSLAAPVGGCCVQQSRSDRAESSDAIRLAYRCITNCDRCGGREPTPTSSVQLLNRGGHFEAGASGMGVPKLEFGNEVGDQCLMLHLDQQIRQHVARDRFSNFKTCINEEASMRIRRFVFDNFLAFMAALSLLLCGLSAAGYVPQESWEDSPRRLGGERGSAVVIRGELSTSASLRKTNRQSTKPACAKHLHGSIAAQLRTGK